MHPRVRIVAFEGTERQPRARARTDDRATENSCIDGQRAANSLAVADLGVAISGRVPVVLPSNKHSVGYMKAKTSRMGHLTGL